MPLAMEYISAIQGGIEIDSNRTLVLRSVSERDLTMLDRTDTIQFVPRGKGTTAPYDGKR